MFRLLNRQELTNLLNFKIISDSMTANLTRQIFGQTEARTAISTFAIGGDSVLHRHICARWKFSSPNEV